MGGGKEVRSGRGTQSGDDCCFHVDGTSCDVTGRGIWHWGRGMWTDTGDGRRGAPGWNCACCIVSIQCVT